MPGIAALSDLRRAVQQFVITDLPVAFDPRGLAAARRALDASGVLLLGEVHGVRENPLVVRELMRVLELRSLALEWSEELTTAIETFLAEGTVVDHPLLWSGDGRITVGHLAVLGDRAAAGPLQLILFDGAVGAGWTWSERDEAMATRVLTATAGGAGTLVVAGNAHTPTQETTLGVPLGAVLARHRPGVRDVAIQYGGGGFYNFGSRRFGPHFGPDEPARLCERGGRLLIDLPRATEAVVPHRPDQPLGPLPPH
jgi:hypothetical protein